VEYTQVQDHSIIMIIIIIIIIIIIKTYLCRITISVIENCYQHGSCVK